MQEDRRKDTRIDASFSFSYRVYTRTDIAGDISQIKNISLGGAQITTSHELNTDNILEINFRIPKSRNKITLLGKVLESWKIPEKDLFISRISFAYPPKVTQEMMSELIKEIESV